MTDRHAWRIGDCALDIPLVRAALEALDRANVGVIITDGDAAVVFINKVARPLVSGPLLFLRDDRLDGARKPMTVQLHRMIRELAGSATGAVSTDADAAPGHHPSLFLAGITLRSKGGAQRRLALILLPGEPKCTPGHRLEDIELTPAETRLLRALVSGQQMRSYAAEAGIALTTAKTHLRGLFDKTGERRQSTLILRALSDPVLRAKWSK